MFVRNVGTCLLNYTESYPKIPYLNYNEVGIVEKRKSTGQLRISKKAIGHVRETTVRSPKKPTILVPATAHGYFVAS
jgi:hypothetical protein